MRLPHSLCKIPPASVLTVLRNRAVFVAVGFTVILALAIAAAMAVSLMLAIVVAVMLVGAALVAVIKLVDAFRRQDDGATVVRLFRRLMGIG